MSELSKDKMIGNKPGMVGGVTEKQAKKSQKDFEKFLKKKKSGLHGKKISKKDALRGLGDPANWNEFSAKIYEDFNRKPILKNKNEKSLIDEIREDFDLGSI